MIGGTTMSQTASAETDRFNATVFISYTRADELSALALDQWLRNRGARVLIDQRDFIPGSDIEAEIGRCVRAAAKFVCVYSRNSATRPYPELERRIASALERTQVATGTVRERRLIYFKLDDTPLPIEALPRLAILAATMSLRQPVKSCGGAFSRQRLRRGRIDLTLSPDTSSVGTTARYEIVRRRHGPRQARQFNTSRRSLVIAFDSAGDHRRSRYRRCRACGAHEAAQSVIRLRMTQFDSRFPIPNETSWTFLGQSEVRRSTATVPSLPRPGQVCSRRYA